MHPLGARGRGGGRVTPYYEDDAVTIYHGDCREVLTEYTLDVVVSDPPYPNNAAHFIGDIQAAYDFCSMFTAK